jgi:hypothetical protein
MKRFISTVLTSLALFICSSAASGQAGQHADEYISRGLKARDLAAAVLMPNREQWVSYVNDIEFFCLVTENYGDIVAKGNNGGPKKDGHQPKWTPEQRELCNAYSRHTNSDASKEGLAHVCARANMGGYWGRTDLSNDQCAILLNLDSHKKRLDAAKILPKTFAGKDNPEWDTHNGECTLSDYKQWESKISGRLFGNPADADMMERIATLALFQKGFTNDLGKATDWPGYKKATRLQCKETRTKGVLGMLLVEAHMSQKCELVELSSKLLEKYADNYNPVALGAPAMDWIAVVLEKRLVMGYVDAYEVIMEELKELLTNKSLLGKITSNGKLETCNSQLLANSRDNLLYLEMNRVRTGLECGGFDAKALPGCI